MRKPLLSIWDLEFTQYEFLWALLVVPLLVWLYIYLQQRKRHTLKLSGISFAHSKPSFFPAIKHTLFALQMIGLSLLILGMGRPQDPDKEKIETENFTKGIDIMIAMDLSGSMLAEDFKNEEAGIEHRLDASIAVAKEFVDKRENDNVGLVVYGGEAMGISALSNDHKNLKEQLDRLQTEMVTPMTAIGEGLLLAAASFYKSKAKSKIVILLTDGVNNFGETDPMDAARHAASFNMRVYTIGIGTDGEALVPVNRGGFVVKQPMPVEIDEDLLKEISNTTGGKYFRAHDEFELRAVYDEIDRLEKSKIKTAAVRIAPPEEFRTFAIPGLILLLLPLLLHHTVLRELP